jgi:hypothetical protein
MEPRVQINSPLILTEVRAPEWIVGVLGIPSVPPKLLGSDRSARYEFSRDQLSRSCFGIEMFTSIMLLIACAAVIGFFVIFALCMGEWNDS